MQKETRQCQSCSADFTIEAEDFAFYEKMEHALPPVDCPECRFKERGPYALGTRSCSSCTTVIETSNSDETAPVLYCEECYQREVL